LIDLFDLQASYPKDWGSFGVQDHSGCMVVGLVCVGLVWSGLVWFGLVWSGLVCLALGGADMVGSRT